MPHLTELPFEQVVADVLHEFKVGPLVEHALDLLQVLGNLVDELGLGDLVLANVAAKVNFDSFSCLF